MARVEERWEHLVRVVLRRERMGRDLYERHGTGIAGNVPSSLANNRDIDEILRAADEIQDEDPNISRILCEHGYSLAQNLDPNSEGRGVLQFKTGLMSVIKQKLARREGATIDRSQDITRLQEFYKLYRQKNYVEQLREEEAKLRESAVFSGNLGELERKTGKRKRVFATLRVLGTVLVLLTEDIPEELKRVIESDAAMTEDLIAYIIPLDAPSITNVITSLAEVQTAVSGFKYFRGLPKLPTDFPIPATREPDMLDFLHYVFGFQKDNVSNQREHIVHLLANEQSRLRIPDETEPILDEAAVQNVFLKSLDNYIKWCSYLVIQPVWSNLESVSKEKKLLFASMYCLIWGEAANVRFLPECLCYIFHHMAREMDEILRQQIAQPANSCISENGVSFLDQVIYPLFEIVSADAGNNENGRAPDSAWRNYDDFNEYFWSLGCFHLSWPWRKVSLFFQKPMPRSKKMARVEERWERLVRAVLRRERMGRDLYERHGTGIAGNVPSSLANYRDIDEILRAADEIRDEDFNISRILCEHGYLLAHNLDPNSEGRGVLQFKTGLMSVIGIKRANWERLERATIDRSQDIACLQEFYKLYGQKNNVEQLREKVAKLRESAVFSGNLGELERKTVKRKRVFATLRVLGTVLAQLTEDVPEELKPVVESDAAMTEDLIAYDIIPPDAPSVTNVITSLAEVQAAVSGLKYFRGLPKFPTDFPIPATREPDMLDFQHDVFGFPVQAVVSGLKYFRGLPKLPTDFPIPATREPDMLDFLHYVFGFQKDNVSNQREHIVHLLANEQSRLRIPDETEPILDEAAVRNVFLKSLDNYIKWCSYLVIQPVWSNLESVSKEKKLLFASMYCLIWGEAANVRFLPECLCYIFHHMAREMDEILRQPVAQPANSCISENGVSFLDQVIYPLFEIVSAEAGNNENGRAPHSGWRNYDDFNEYFWSLGCFDLSWPWCKGSSFFQKPTPRSKNILKSGRSLLRGKTSFVEHRTFLHLYHSFHHLWIFLVMMFQGLAIIAFNNQRFDAKCIREVLSLGPTFVGMKFLESVLDVLMMYGAYSTSRSLVVSRIFLRLIWFGAASVVISLLYVKALQEESKQNGNPVIYRLYLMIVGIYAGIQFFISFFMRIPACHSLTNQCDRWSLIHFVKWMRQERYYVGRGMFERTTDFIKYMFFWLVILSGKFSFAYFLQIKPLVKPTRIIVQTNATHYTWHDLVSGSNYNALTVAALWAPVVAIYLLDLHVFYTLVSAVWGFFLGARDRLGEIRSMEALHKLFEQFPGAFMDTLHIRLPNRAYNQSSSEDIEKNKVDASRFSPFWNEIIHNLREEDYITDLEMEMLVMPKNSGGLPLVQWPLFLLASKIFIAKDIALETRDSQDELWERVSRDNYMKYAVQDCFYSIKLILSEILEGEGKMWAERLYEDIQGSIVKKNIQVDFQLNKLPLVISRVTALMGILKKGESSELVNGAVKAVQDLYDIVRYDVLSMNLRVHYDTWNLLSKARTEGWLFVKLKWPKDPSLIVQVKRVYSLLTIQESAANVPRNLEARRRLQFFTNSLFMEMPEARPVREMLSFSVFTPYYAETVLYSIAELQKKNEDGISVLFYLQKIYPDEWKNFLSRIGRDENAHDSELFDNPSDILELRFWASYRGQTLARTVRGMMYYRKALMLQTYLERLNSGDMEAAISSGDAAETRAFELSPEARAQADLKFTYVVTCQIYGKQKEGQKPEAADIALLMQRNEALRVAFIDEVETLKDGKVNREFYSKLVKGDINGKDKEIYSIKLPGDPNIGEGKPEDQNHAIVFTRGNAIQTIDMNQDNYFEEALKMRNLLEEFHCDHGIRRPRILGVREYVFTGSVSSLASFMCNQETSFVTLAQANPLKVRMHYGHPDVFHSVLAKKQGTASSCSSSSSSYTTHDHQSWAYDVFLSFRGADVRNNFVGHLHANLVRKGIKTFIDDEELERGDEISNALIRAIEESKISIIVFSENYASSRWCLEELVKILDCKESKQHLVYPVFYKVDPSDVRHQRGSFGQALAHHESRFKANLEKVTRWREALTKASNLSGLHFIDGSHESKFIDTIVEGISAQLLDRIHLSVAKYPVGIQSRVEDVLKLVLVGEDDVRMVGIWGIGGIGKTTIAKGLYNSIAHNFEGSCFLENVRERSTSSGGLVELQNSLLSKILKEKDLRITSVDEGITLIKQRLCHKKVLLVLDDVNHLNQLNSSVGKSDWFGSGSRIIITTRDKRWLTAHDVDYIYKMKELSHHEALDLFKFHVFKENQKMDDYVHLIDNITLYAQGLPLALKVLGSYLRGRNVDQWKVALDGYAREPKKEIQEILRISYDALDDMTKEIFLHIACFFKGKGKNHVMDILRGCDLNPEYGIEVLAEKALISINEENDIVMHDLLEEMGKEIVRQESPTEPGERSRLWQYEDVYRVFMENTGSNKVRGIVLNWMNPREKIHLNSESFSKMKNLQIFVSPPNIFTGDRINYLSNELRLLDWGYCPLSSFPPSFYPKKLVGLRMHECQTSPLSEVPKTMQSLIFINMSNCHGVRRISGLSMFPNLRFLDLSCCTNLVEVEVGYVKNLEYLNLSGCEELEKFEIVEEMRSLKILDLGCTGIKEFPSSSIRYLVNLEELLLEGCDSLTTVPCSILELQHLKYLDLSECNNLVTFPTNCETRTTKLRYDPLFIDLKECKSLVEILEFPREIDRLDTWGCESLRKISSLSNIVEGKVSKLIPWMELHLCRTLCRNLANEYLARMERDNILPRDNSEVTALLSLFLSCWQSSFRICFPAASEIPLWLNCCVSSRLERVDPDIGFGVYKFKIGNFKVWESKGGLAFCVQHTSLDLDIGSAFELRTIDINGVCIIQRLANDRHYEWKRSGFVWLHYIPFDTIVRRLSEAGIGLLPDSFDVNVEFDYKFSKSTNARKCNCGVHVVLPEFGDGDGVVSVTYA